ncbi:hypothetical protein [Moorena bouillonii]|nr:hypothetical protein [Moorena bouillonii]
MNPLTCFDMLWLVCSCFVGIVISRSQIAVIIALYLLKELNSYVKRIGISKTEVVVGALALYLGCESDVPLNQRLALLKAKV